MQRLIKPAIVVLVIALLAFMATLLPRGYDTDLSQVGKGRSVVVMVHDPGIVQSGNLMHALDDVRGEFEPRLQFLLADQNLASGVAFADAYQLPIATLALLDGEGRLLDVYRSGPDREALRRWLAHHEDAGALE
jgi:hypothetical protein